MTTAEEWKPWNEERQRFLELETQGWLADIATLEAHISTLANVAPKDKAGWVNQHALEVIDKLRLQLKAAKVWAGLMP